MAVNIEIPTVGESVTEGVIGAWVKGDGEWVERDETVLELETDKITMEIPAPASGVLKHGAAEGDTVAVGAVVGSIDDTAEKPAGAGASSATVAASEGGAGSERAESTTAVAEPPAVSSPAASAPAPSAPTGPGTNGDVRATPLAKKLASEKRVDLHGVRGTGPGGRVREQDVLAAIQGVESAAKGVEASVPSPRPVTVEKMSPMR